MPSQRFPFLTRIHLNKPEFPLLLRTARSVTRSRREVLHATVIVLAHRGWDDPTIAVKIEIDPRPVGTRGDHFLHERREGLLDRQADVPSP